MVERSNIIIDGNGYTLQGSGSGDGLILPGLSNVTVKNTEIRGFIISVLLNWTSHSVFSGNNIILNGIGIYLDSSYNNTLSENNITNNGLYGIVFDYSSNNSIFGNNMTANDGWAGIGLLVGSENNTFYHNNFLDEVMFTSMGTCGYVNFWDNGYPSGGNYWGGYTGVDFYSGPDQIEPGSDGIGDTPFILDRSNCSTIGREDRYPLMGLFGPLTVEGENVTVFPSDDVGLIFESVTLEGTTIVNKTDAGPDPPSGFQLAGQYYDIQTTAEYSDTITIRIVYDDSYLSQAEEETLKLMQWDETLQEWIDITTSVDTQNNVIYGETTHLSIFGVTRRSIIPGDVDRDGDVDIFDIVRIAGAYDSEEGDARYVANCDIDGDGDVDIFDVVIAAGHYGESW